MEEGAIELRNVRGRKWESNREMKKKRKKSKKGSSFGILIAINYE